MIRPTTLTYPNARAITISYGTSGGINDSASRVDALVDGATTLVNYTYLGAGIPVQTTYPQPSIQHTLLGSSGGTSPAGDIYWGLDNFGRIIDSRWYNTGSGVDVDRIKYGYDRASNRIWRENPVATAASAKFDEIYRNDGLQRLKDMQRGTLNGSNSAVTSPTFGQCWTLDPTGNWLGFNESTNGSSWTLTQTRTSNPVNEITGITNTVGSAWAATAYDAAGNMTSMPRPATPTSGYTAIYDAWNRLVAVKAGASFIQQNQYDARNFRTVILSYSGGVLSETRHSYFTTNWRCIEERVGSATTAERHFVWGARYIDDLVERDRDTTGGGTLNQRLYALQDANWNMSALTSTAGVVAERYAYSPYGRPIFLSSAYVVRSISSYAWETLYCGYRYDSISQLFPVRSRVFHPLLGGWNTRDPIAYAGGINLQAYVNARPNNITDAFGLASTVENALSGIGNTFIQLGYYFRDCGAGALETSSILLSRDVVGFGTIAPVNFQDWSAAALSNQPSDPNFWQTTRSRALNAGLAGFTAGGTQVISAVQYYVETEDVDGAQQQLFSIAGVNTFAASTCPSRVPCRQSAAPRSRSPVSPALTEGQALLLAEAEAYAFAARLRRAAENTRRGEVPQAASVTFCAQTGRFYRAIPRGGNSHLGQQPTTIHPSLRRLMPETSLENFPTTNCAEFNSQNAALLDGGSPRYLYQFTVNPARYLNRNPPVSITQPKGSCGNCSITNQNIIWINPRR